jgi:hypothetical protein
MKLIFRVFVSDQLCDIIQWRGFVESKTVKEIGLSQLHNLVAVIVGNGNVGVPSSVKLERISKAKSRATFRLVRTISPEVSDFLLCFGLKPK